MTLLSLALGISLAVLPAGGATAQAAPTRAELKGRADQLMGLSLNQFDKISAAARAGKYNAKGSNRRLDSVLAKNRAFTTDGCSKVPDLYMLKSCRRHDFGYRAYGSGLALAPRLSQKTVVDKRFVADMKSECQKQGGKKSCSAQKKVFTWAISHVTDNSFHNAWHKSSCPDGYLCLWAGTDAHGKREVYTASSNLATLGSYNGLARNYENRLTGSKRYAYIYRDKNYAGKQKDCVKPHRVNRSNGPNRNAKIIFYGSLSKSLKFVTSC